MQTWLRKPHELAKTKHRDILDTIGNELAKRQAPTNIYKVKAHTDVEGNEIVDGTAKEAAETEDKTTLHHVENIKPPEMHIFQPRIDNQPVTHLKNQLRPIVSSFIADKHGMLDTIYNKWTKEKTTLFDKIPSNWHWRKRGDIPSKQFMNILRARNNELICNGVLHQKASDANKATQTDKCPLCGKIDTWLHMVTMCSHPEISPHRYTRHHEAARKINSKVMNGKYTRWLMLMNAGKTDG